MAIRHLELAKSDSGAVIQGDRKACVLRGEVEEQSCLAQWTMAVQNLMAAARGTKVAATSQMGRNESEIDLH